MYERWEHLWAWNSIFTHETTIKKEKDRNFVGFEAMLPNRYEHPRGMEALALDPKMTLGMFCLRAYENTHKSVENGKLSRPLALMYNYRVHDYCIFFSVMNLYKLVLIVLKIGVVRLETDKSKLFPNNKISWSTRATCPSNQDLGCLRAGLTKICTLKWTVNINFPVTVKSVHPRCVVCSLLCSFWWKTCSLKYEYYILYISIFYFSVAFLSQRQWKKIWWQLLVAEKDIWTNTQINEGLHGIM